jgi:hypothetical protein
VGILSSSGVTTGPTGLPVTVITGNTLTYNSHSVSAAVSTTLLRRLSISMAYSNSSYVTTSSSLLVDSRSRVMNGYLVYPYRKLQFRTGFTQLYQDISTSIAKPGTLTSYYFGISRWLNFF